MLNKAWFSRMRKNTSRPSLITPKVTLKLRDAACVGHSFPLLTCWGHVLDAKIASPPEPKKVKSTVTTQQQKKKNRLEIKNLRHVFLVVVSSSSDSSKRFFKKDLFSAELMNRNILSRVVCQEVLNTNAGNCGFDTCPYPGYYHLQ